MEDVEDAPALPRSFSISKWGKQEREREREGAGRGREDLFACSQTISGWGNS